MRVLPRVEIGSVESHIGRAWERDGRRKRRRAARTVPSGEAEREAKRAHIGRVGLLRRHAQEFAEYESAHQ